MIVVHGRANSTNVQKVLWLFDEIGLPFERFDRGGKFGGLDDPDYRALNPNGLVPTVIDGDLVLWESHAILRHYARQNPGAALFPGDAADAAHSDMMLDWTITTLWPPLRVAYVAVEREGKPLESPEVQQALDKAHRPLDILEGQLAGRDYVGGSFGIGDIPPAICLSRWLYLGRDLAAWPAVEAWYARCSARPAFRNRVIVGG
ncbi:glutathione S-transferase family protein [Pelagibius sp. 7325]|uniref:glutathione S-transferase family protein n=1 Tax=Pelagibius sp. 7325 TaxID=3131994 RepID=UPI0030EEF148